MTFTHVQFIGYALNTAPRAEYTYAYTTGGGENVFDEKKFYLGSSNQERDVKARVRIMSKAIETAYVSGQLSSDSSHLKLFMAPEFFFRGRLGAYPMDHVQEVIKQLRALVHESRFSNWIFVFGSILGYSRGTGGSLEVYNFTLVQKGNSGESSSRVVMKEFKSGIDFIGDKVRFTGTEWIRALPTIGLTDSRVAHLEPARTSGRGREVQKVNYDGSGIFELADITFGVEVCLDHLEKRLRASPLEVGQKQVQMQLVPSAGMEIKQPSVVAIKHGLVFNCDGSYGLAGRTPADAHTQLHKVTKMYVGTRDASTTEILPAHELNVDATEGFDTYYAKGPGQVHIYAPERIPSATTEQLSGR